MSKFDIVGVAALISAAIFAASIGIAILAICFRAWLLKFGWNR